MQNYYTVFSRIQNSCYIFMFPTHKFCQYNTWCIYIYIYIYILFLPFGNKFQQLKLWNRDFKESPQLDPQLNLTRPQLLVITPHILLLLHGVNYAKILHCKWFLHIFYLFTLRETQNWITKRDFKETPQTDPQLTKLIPSKSYSTPVSTHLRLLLLLLLLALVLPLPLLCAAAAPPLLLLVFLAAAQLHWLLPRYSMLLLLLCNYLQFLWMVSENHGPQLHLPLNLHAPTKAQCRVGAKLAAM